MIKNEMPEFPVIYANVGVEVAVLFIGLGEPLKSKPATIPQISVNTAAGTGGKYRGCRCYQYQGQDRCGAHR
jgi:hypothetical protein